VRLLVKDEKVDGEHRQDERVESHPHPQLVHRSGSIGAYKEKGETLAPGLFAARAKVSPFPVEPDRTVRRGRSLDDPEARRSRAA
jgi:hypothetical protein